MAKRRANHEGCIYKRVDRGNWRAQITIDGKRRSFTGDTQEECQEWLKDIRNLADQGYDFDGAEMPLADFLSDWLVSLGSSRAQRTNELYEWIITKRILPYLGRVKLKDLKPDRIQSYYATLKRDGLSAHAVHCAHKVLNSALGHAMKLGTLARNPCKATTPPKPKQTEMRIYDEGQIQVFLDTALALQDQYYPLYYLAIHTGMRQGELIGLKWVDIDWRRDRLKVRRQVTRPRGGGYRFSKPKSKRGNRTITLGQKALEILRMQQMTALEKRKTAGEAWADHDLVFPTRVGTPILNSNLRRGFRKVLVASGLPKIRFHDLRHTAASLMLNHGIPLLIVSQRLGHSRPSITLDVYGHLIPSKQEEAAELMDDLLSPLDARCTPFAPMHVG